MAFYVFEINIPANTPQSAPVVVTKDVLGEVLRQLTIYIPNGQQGLAKIRVEDRERPIIPTLGSDPPWIRGDGNMVQITANYRLPGPQYQLRFVGYNDDTVNDHAMIIHVDVQNLAGPNL